MTADRFLDDWAAVHWRDLYKMSFRDCLELYARNAWRPVTSAPVDEDILVWNDMGVIVMRKSSLGEWRDTVGKIPQREPQAWMPAPVHP